RQSRWYCRNRWESRSVPFFTRKPLLETVKGFFRFRRTCCAQRDDRREPLSLRGYRKRFMGIYGPDILPCGHKKPVSSSGMSVIRFISYSC
ncbi:hypothetical protein ACR78Z_19580, partial [Sphingobacterium thalpophilum]|uniref:hypothetical protein n=1 Tax=Sphingobacterium thalpophilum TaxID=259 RepID=UPI003DA59630